MSDIPFRPELQPAPIPPPLPEFPWECYEPHARRRPSAHRRAVYHSPPIPHALATVTMGASVEHRGLAVTPLVGDDDPACDYVVLEESLASGLVTIREVSVRGDMNELHVFNRGDRPLLILDGEELAGSVQNRVLNLSVLVGKRSKAYIPVSCVEAGRCDGQTFRFTTASRMQFASGRAEKMAQVSRSMSSRDQRQANQVSIWSAIRQKAERLGVSSNTEAMAAIYEQHAAALDEYVDALGSIEHCRGALFTVHGRLAGLELLDSASTWMRLMPKILRSYAIDALGERVDQQKPVGFAPDAFLHVVGEADTCSFTTFGDGFDVRFKGQAVTGGALVFGSRIIHLVAFTNRYMELATLASPQQCNRCADSGLGPVD